MEKRGKIEMIKIKANRYITKDNHLDFHFLPIPRIFFTSEIYQGLSNDAKIAYAEFFCLTEISKKNNWIDKNNRFYFMYTNKKLMELLNVKGKDKLIKIKRELINCNLLTEIQVLGRPSIYYLLLPIFDDNKMKKEKEFYYER